MLALATRMSQQRNWPSCHPDLSGPHLWAGGPGPALVLDGLNSLNPGEPSTEGQGKPETLRRSSWAVEGSSAAPSAPVGQQPWCALWEIGVKGVTRLY